MAWVQKMWALVKKKWRGWRGPTNFGVSQKKSWVLWVEILKFKNFAKFRGKHLCWGVFLNKVAGWKPANLLKKRLQRRCLLVNFAKILTTPILLNICTLFITMFCLAFFEFFYVKSIIYLLFSYKWHPITFYCFHFCKL